MTRQVVIQDLAGEQIFEDSSGNTVKGKRLNGLVGKVIAVAMMSKIVTLSFQYYLVHGKPAKGDQPEVITVQVPIANVRSAATAYGKSMCQKLVELDQDRTLHNADNFMWVVLELAAEGIRPAGEWPCDIFTLDKTPESVKVEVYCTEDVSGELAFRTYKGQLMPIKSNLQVQAMVRNTNTVPLTEDIKTGTFVFTARHGGLEHAIATDPLVARSPCDLRSRMSGAQDEVVVTVQCARGSGLVLSARDPLGERANLRTTGSGSAITSIVLSMPTGEAARYRFPADPSRYYEFELSVEDAGRRFSSVTPPQMAFDLSSLCTFEVTACGTYCTDVSTTCQIDVYDLVLSYFSNSQKKTVQVPVPGLEHLAPFKRARGQLELNMKAKDLLVFGHLSQQGPAKIQLWRGAV